ncbi:hypothetical protein N7499_010145 [Penicillium canescens]|uniref:Uncharacterized protein n=1 Tax=Penicillium canescens TaxID=5083 RepID=A0AAD6INF8_PENCN|nr:uncharacterized protein N7446_007714 [Penicillium canescens]KAJ6018663.1 hypothetical protein N7522_000730 [Penicillium canescens]KAJ6033989.1 hypothetical protein N7444_011760 [Penicillium canescens]KAJ6056823.1 hypothetical protein N7460_000097 [Penicillium canescens]KAJ6058131.1 hypothetical protein N7446_007714 [Penicillium canescens]KAJ6072131.1 hypothetical protein N7499_010145 [Penicillium canescens]
MYIVRLGICFVLQTLTLYTIYLPHDLLYTGSTGKGSCHKILASDAIFYSDLDFIIVIAIVIAISLALAIRDPVPAETPPGTPPI